MPKTSSARLFGWVPVAGASSYEVEFDRDGQTIFTAVVPQPPLSLPARWSYEGRSYALEPGVYRWYVRPIFPSGAGTRRGPPSVDSELNIPG